MNDHERGLLDFLIEPGKRRMRTLLELGKKRRADVQSLLDHAILLDPRFSKLMEAAEAQTEFLERLLRARGAPSMCHVLSANMALDGRELPLSETLGLVIGQGNGTFVSCIPGQLGVYEYEDAQSTYLLSKPSL